MIDFLDSFASRNLDLYSPLTIQLLVSIRSNPERIQIPNRKTTMMMITKQFILIIILFVAVLVVALSQKMTSEMCPPYQTIYPCFCSFMQKYEETSAAAGCQQENGWSDSARCQSSVITCMGDGSDSLRKSFNNLAHYNNLNNIIRKFDWFYLVDTKITSLEGELFANVHFENIYLQNCPRLQYIHENAFGNESRLQVKNLYINASTLSDHPRLRRKTFKALSALKNLNVLEIQTSNLLTIPVKAFNKFTDVKIIRFYNPDVRQKLIKISSKSFYRATNVVEIDLKNNQISAISSYAFHFQRPSNHEVKIFLSGNSLHSDSFEPKAFDGSNGRRMVLYLGDYDNCNLLLKTLKQNVFESFLLENRYNIIDMYGCPLVCDQQMDWLINTDDDRFKNQVRNLVCYNRSNLINTDKYEYYHVSS